MRLEFSPRPQVDLLSILHHIAADKPQAAKQLVAELEKRCRRNPIVECHGYARVHGHGPSQLI